MTETQVKWSVCCKNTCDAHHKKTDLRVFVVARAHPSFGMTPTYREFDLWSQETQILRSRCHTKGRMGTATMTKTLRSVFLWHTSHVSCKIFAIVIAKKGLAGGVLQILLLLSHIIMYKLTQTLLQHIMDGFELFKLIVGCNQHKSVSKILWCY